jgi:hypothetical protein
MTGQIEFSHVYEIGRLPKSGIAVPIAATTNECAAIAARARIPEIADFSVEYFLQFLPHSDVLSIKGRVSATITQVCVRSLEPFSQKLQFDFECQGMAHTHLPAVPETLESVPGEVEITDEGFEPIVNNRMDLGELAVQQFILELDPYPKNPQAEPLSRSWELQEGAAHPMAQLKLLKKN